MTQEITIIDHVTNAADNFLSQYENADKFKTLVNIFLEELNEIEDEVNLFLTIRSISTSEGENLDRWGDILEAPTRPVDDEDFRGLLYGLISAYNSEGTNQDIFSILSNLVEPQSSIYIYDYNDGSFDIAIVGWTSFIAKDHADSIVRLGKPASIIFGGITSIADAYTPFFAFDSDTHADADGFSSIGGTDGGYYGIKL